MKVTGVLFIAICLGLAGLTCCTKDPLVENQDFEIWMMDSGGTLIWDQDLPDIGRNLFNDPYYDPFPNLKIALEKIVAEEYRQTTYVGGTIRLFEAARQAGVHRFVYISFIHVYDQLAVGLDRLRRVAIHSGNC